MSKYLFFTLILIVTASINNAIIFKTNCSEAPPEIQSSCRRMQNSMLMSMDKMAADQPPAPVTQEPVNEPSTQKEMAAEQPPVPNTQEPVNEPSTQKEKV
ncbi:unnamed protein product [Meloidogyne enterolobii]|uniref:Uncharacterized protein n=1 Tax=Meloidogyne enterolobii TaxID=390850 RepID=A0ACB1AL04_MELEN